jgi:hypothetical protein
MKYGDTILKGFATSVAVVSHVLSIFIWNAQVDGWFVISSHGHDSSCSLLKYPPAEGNHNASQNQVDVEKNIRC